jgi:hypothetical protein
VLHTRADIVMVSNLGAAPAAHSVPALAPYDLTPAEVYQQGLLFHGPQLHALAQIEGCDASGMVASLHSAPAPAMWMRQPMRPHWLADPLVLDGAMQMVILWTRHQRGAPSLPVHIRRYRQWRRAFPSEGVRALVAVERSTDRLALCNVDFVDPEGRLIARLEGYEAVIDPALDLAYRRKALVLA